MPQKEEDNERLNEAEKLIEEENLDGAQEILNGVKQKSGKKFYLQSRIYNKKKWYGEQRKMLKAAVKAEPDNETYAKELEELEAFSKTDEYKTAQKNYQMGQAGSCCAEGGAECCCLCLCEGLCEGLANGC